MRATVRKVSKRDLSYAAWLSRRRRDAARYARLNSLLPPYHREKLRSEAEALFLRRIGTPERLIGPVGSEDEVDREQADLLKFARRLRTTAIRT